MTQIITLLILTLIFTLISLAVWYMADTEHNKLWLIPILVSFVTALTLHCIFIHSVITELEKPAPVTIERDGHTYILDDTPAKSIEVGGQKYILVEEPNDEITKSNNNEICADTDENNNDCTDDNTSIYAAADKNILMSMLIFGVMMGVMLIVITIAMCGYIFPR